MISQEKLKEVLHYDPDTGIFTWKVSTSNRVKVGDIAGTIQDTGYINISFNGRRYGAHRLAILYKDGYWPEGTVDHKDRIRYNNRYDNLREASNQCQMRNCGMNRKNKSGVKGVIHNKSSGKILAVITVDYKKGILVYLQISWKPVITDSRLNSVLVSRTVI